jgi:hypothetical protein
MHHTTAEVFLRRIQYGRPGVHGLVCGSHAKKLAFLLRSCRSLLGCAVGLDVLQNAGVLYCSSCSSTVELSAS